MNTHLQKTLDFKDNKEFVYKEILQNGLVVCVHEMPWAQSVTARLLVSAGPRWEDERTIGTAHYLEHMIFEGSQKYPSRRDIDKAIQRIGGKHSAYTDKEYVMYQAKVQPSYANFSTQFLREMVFNPSMSEDAFIREKGIIKSELQKNIDNPTKYQWDLVRRFMWGSHPLAYNTLGTFQSIQDITLDDLKQYHNSFYRPDNAILVISGNIQVSEAMSMARKDFGDLVSQGFQKRDTPAPNFVRPKPRVYIEEKDLKETQILLPFSTEGVGIHSEDQFALKLLARIFREKIFYKFVYEMGVSYLVTCYPWLVSDNGSLVFVLGVHPEQVNQAIEVLINEINNTKVSSQVLDDAKEVVKSDVTLNIADTDQYAHFIGEQLLYRNEILTPEQTKNRIDSVTVEEVVRLKDKIVRDDTVALILYGNEHRGREKELDKKLKF